MIGAPPVVREGSAAELGERHHGHSADPRRIERCEEPLDSGVQFLHSHGVLIGLAGVAVEVAEAGREDAETEIRVDQSCGDFELGDDFGVGQLVVFRDDRAERGRQLELVDLRLADTAEPRVRGADTGQVANRREQRSIRFGAPLPRDTEAGSSGRDGRCDRPLADHVQRNRVSDLGRREQILVPTEVAVEPTAEPAAAGEARRSTGHPLRHRVEVAELLLHVADALDDRQLVGIPEALELAEVGVQAGVRIERQGLFPWDRERTVLVVVAAIVDRDDRVESVVAAVHPDDDEDAVGRPDRTERPRRRIVAREDRVEQ